MTTVKSSLYPRAELDKLMRDVQKISVQLDAVTQQDVNASQLTPKEVARDDLFKQAQTCVIEMNKFCYQKKHGRATDMAGVEILELQPSQCCFMAPYGSTCLGTMCKMKSRNTTNHALVTKCLS